jgi:hypothetical protein
LIVVTMAATSVLTIYLTARQMHRNLSQRLDAGSRGIEIEINNLKRDMLSRVKAISSDEDIILAFKNKDIQAFLYLLEDLRKVTGADIATAIDNNGIVLARGHSPAQYGDDVSGSTAFLRTQKGEEVVDFSSGISGMGVRVFVPVKIEDEIIGQLNVGKLLGYDYIKRLKDKYGLDIIVYDKKRLQAATFTSPHIIDSPDLDDLMGYVQTYKDSVSKEVRLAGKEYYVMARPILSNDKQVVGEYFLAISQKTIHHTLIMLSVLFSPVVMLIAALYCSLFLSLVRRCYLKRKVYTPLNLPF